MPRNRLIFACMTGTSLDALDAAALRVTGERLDLTSEVAAFNSAPFGPFADPLRTLAQGIEEVDRHHGWLAQEDRRRIQRGDRSLG